MKKLKINLNKYIIPVNIEFVIKIQVFLLDPEPGSLPKTKFFQSYHIKVINHTLIVNPFVFLKSKNVYELFLVLVFLLEDSGI